MSGATDDPIEDLWQVGRATFDGIALDLERFRAHLVGLRAASVDRRAEAVPAIHGADLFLACACALGDPTAHRLLDVQLLPSVLPAIRRIDGAPPFVDEVLQRLRTRLLVDDGERGPRIAAYAGRGPLAGWLRVVAVRIALDLKDRTEPEIPTRGSVLEALSPPIEGLVQADLKLRFSGPFRRALTEACRDLAERDRTVLRLRFQDDLSIDQIGVIYGTHRATVARWIARSRERLLADTRARLGAALGLGSEDLDSMLRLAASDLDVSLISALGAEAP